MLADKKSPRVLIKAGAVDNGHVIRKLLWRWARYWYWPIEQVSFLDTLSPFPQGCQPFSVSRH